MQNKVEEEIAHIVYLVKIIYFGKIEILQLPESYWVEFGIMAKVIFPLVSNRGIILEVLLVSPKGYKPSIDMPTPPPPILWPRDH